MALSVGNSSNSGVLASVSSSTHSHNNNGEDVIVMVAIRDTETAATVSGITYAGASMTEDKTVLYEDSDSSADLRCYIFRKQGATSGANDVVVTFSDTIDHGAVFALSVNDLHDYEQPNATASDTGTLGEDPSTAVTTTATDTILIDVVYNKTGNALTKEAAQTQIGNLSPNGGGDRAAASYKIVSSSGAKTMSWTTASDPDQDDWAQAVVAYKQTVTGNSPSVSPSVSPSQSPSQSPSLSPSSSKSPSQSPSLSPSSSKSPSLSPSSSVSPSTPTSTPSSSV